MRMRRSGVSIAIFIGLSAALLQAQSARGGSVSGGPHAGGGHVAGYHITAGPDAGTGGANFGPGTNLRFHRGRGFGELGYWGPWYYPDFGWGLFSGDYLWDLPDYSYQQPVTATSPQLVVVENKDSRAPAAPVEPPKLIEVPQSKDALGPKEASTVKQPSTLFVLKSGERLESHYYLLTSQSLQIDVGREQRTIPVGALDIDSTIAANRERGIELTVPRNSNTVFLSF